MTNQEAISVLESINAKTDYYLINDDARAEAIDMAISALQAQEETVSRKVYEQISWERDIAVMQLKDLGYSLGEKIRTVGDTISRRAAIDALKDLPTWWADEGGYYGGAQPPMKALLGPEDAISAIENLPSVQLNLQPTCNNLATDTISRQAAIDAYIMKCPYFAGKNTIDRSNIGTHIGSCDLEHHYRKVCPSNECLCAERLGLKNG